MIWMLFGLDLAVDTAVSKCPDTKKPARRVGLAGLVKVISIVKRYFQSDYLAFGQWRERATKR